MTSLEINTINIFYVSILNLFYGQICLRFSSVQSLSNIQLFVTP